MTNLKTNLQKIKTVLKYQNNLIYAFTEGYQSSENIATFTNFGTFFDLHGKFADIGQCLNIDKTIYKTGKSIDIQTIPILRLGELQTAFKLNQEINNKAKHLLNFLGKDELRLSMTGIHFDAENMTATNANILSSIPHNLDIKESFILPPDLCQFLPFAKTLKVYDKAIVLALEISGVYCEAYALKIDERYPDYKAVLPQFWDYKKYYELNKSDLLEIGKLTKRVPKDETPCLSFKDSEVILQNLSGVKQGNRVASIGEGKPTQHTILMPLLPVDGLLSLNPNLLIKASKGCESVKVFISDVNKQSAIYLELNYKPTKQTKATYNELLAEIEILKAQLLDNNYV